MIFVQLILGLFFLISAFGFDPQSNSNVAVYWGQNSEGSQQRLSYYCDSTDLDIVIVSFMHVFPNPIQLNFANACEDSFIPGSGILQCPTIAEDIKTCQSKGKLVLLSLGGASGSYSMTDEEAPAFATTLWNLFGNSKVLSPDERPFYDVVIDGFDFDIETNIPTGYVTLANSLRTIFATDTSKNYYLAAAPQCPYPDASVGPLLQQSYIDFVFIQFYNNFCQLNNNQLFNWNTWLDYAQNASPNKNVKLYGGFPGGPSAAGAGYVTPDVIQKAFTPEIMSSPNFGGISLWDASQAWSNVDQNGVSYVHAMKSIVDNAQQVVPPKQSGSATSSSSSSTSSASSSAATSSSTRASPSTTIVTKIATSTHTEYVYAPTTLITIQTSYQIQTTRTQLTTIYGRPTELPGQMI